MAEKKNGGSESDTLEKSAIRLSYLISLFWCWGIVADPAKAPISGWIAWTVICFAVAIARRNSDEPSKMWFLWGKLNVVTVAVIFAVGGGNWAFEKNFPYLAFGMIALVFSLSLDKKYARFGELLGGLSLAFAYVPQLQEWIMQQHDKPSMGLILASLGSMANPTLFGLHSLKTTKRFGSGNTIAIMSSGAFLVTLLHAKLG